MNDDRILFVINPISGVNKKRNYPDQIKNAFDHVPGLSYDIVFTTHRGHATILAKAAVKSDYKYVVAAGGDGTMNEVARALVGTDVVFGLIPAGSGNGLARHLKIPLNLPGALEVIKRQHVIKIDSGKIDGHPFFCTAGVGFDAHIGEVFANKAVRGFKTYVKSSITEYLKYVPAEYVVNGPDGELKKRAFCITFANTAQYGNNAFISPEAEVSDGLLDMVVLGVFPKYAVLDIGRRLFGKTLHRSKYLNVSRGTNFTLERESEGPIHADGEPILAGKKLEVSILPASLNILVP